MESGMLNLAIRSSVRIPAKTISKFGVQIIGKSRSYYSHIYTEEMECTQGTKYVVQKVSFVMETRLCELFVTDEVYHHNVLPSLPWIDSCSCEKKGGG